jgi:hypothetical protein
MSALKEDTGSEQSSKTPSSDAVAVTVIPLGLKDDESAADIVDEG